MILSWLLVIRFDFPFVSTKTKTSKSIRKFFFHYKPVVLLPRADWKHPAVSYYSRGCQRFVIIRRGNSIKFHYSSLEGVKWLSSFPHDFHFDDFEAVVFPKNDVFSQFVCVVFLSCHAYDVEIVAWIWVSFWIVFTLGLQFTSESGCWIRETAISI